MNKTELRKWALETRKNVDLTNISKALVLAVSKMQEYKNSKNIMLFYPMKNEVDLTELLKDKTKKFYLPKICGQDLLCCEYKNGDLLCKSSFNTQEPLTEPTSPNIIDLVIVPALCCDKDNYRLGYGGGFYDRFLKDLTATKISCIPKELVIDTIRPEKFDIKMDKIITN